MKSEARSKKIDLDSFDILDIEISEFKVKNLITPDISEYDFNYASSFTIFLDEEEVYINLYVDITAIYDLKDQKKGVKKSEKICHLSASFVYEIAGLQKLLTPAPDDADGTKQVFLENNAFFFLLNQSYTTLRGMLCSKVADTRYSDMYLPLQMMEDVFKYYPVTVLTTEDTEEDS